MKELKKKGMGNTWNKIKPGKILGTKKMTERTEERKNLPK